MQIGEAVTAGQPRRLPGRFLLIAVALASLGSPCGVVWQETVVPPTIHLTVNGIPDDMKSLLVVPPTGFVVNVSWEPGTHPVDPSLLWLFAHRWGSPSGTGTLFEVPLESDGSGAVGVVSQVFELGTYSLYATLGDTEGNTYYVEYAIAVRPFAGAPPIGSGQQIWLDFESDRDATPGPDFPVDLRAFGLGSTASPQVSDWMLDQVTTEVVARVEDVYHHRATNGLPGPDPVAISFVSEEPGAGEVTRVCIGGEDPSGGVTIGAILTDPKNSNRTSVECATLPPTGIFPRELLILAGDPNFQAIFDALRPATGGIPAGEHPLDATVADPGFDPATATPAEQARWAQLTVAVRAFADVLGSIVAHETGHALGLVPVGAPGGGLFGGSTGPELNHAVTPQGVSPSENFLMNAGNTFTFARLAGLAGNPLPYFRPIDYAYLRDRLVIDAAVTLLAHPPVASSVTPNTINPSGYTQIFVNGSGFLPTPVIRLLNSSYTYNVTGELLLSSSQVRGWVNYSQILPGTYNLELKNPDGQTVVLPSAIVVPAL